MADETENASRHAGSSHPQGVFAWSAAWLRSPSPVGQFPRRRCSSNKGRFTRSVRLVRQGLLTAEWNKSDNNRRAKYYELTRKGRKRLQEETDGWNRLPRRGDGPCRAAGRHMTPIPYLAVPYRQILPSLSNRQETEEELRSHIWCRADVLNARA